MYHKVFEFALKKALSKAVDKLLIDDPYGVNSGIFPNHVVGLNPDEVPVEDVIGNLRADGYEKDVDGFDFHSIKDDINHAMHNGASIEEAKEFAYNQVSERAAEKGKVGEADIAKQTREMGEKLQAILDNAGAPKEPDAKTRGPSAIGTQVAGNIQRNHRADGLGTVSLDKAAKDYDAARNAGMTHTAATNFAENKAKEAAAKSAKNMEQKRNFLDPWGKTKEVADKEKPKTDAKHVLAEDDEKIKSPASTPDTPKGEDEDKKFGRTYGKAGTREFSLRGDHATTGGARKSVDYEYEATRGASRKNDSGGSDRDDPPSKPSAPQKTVDYEFEAIHRESGGSDHDDPPGDPGKSNDKGSLDDSGYASGGYYHVGGVVSDDDPILNEDVVAVTAQEGEFVLSRAALDLVGVDLMGRVNGALRTGDRGTIARLQQVLHSCLGSHDALPEADIKASMNERTYWDANNPEHTGAHARVAREFRVAFPGHSDMDKAEHIGGMITDRNPDTYLDDYKIDIPEGAFVVSRVATKLAGIPALMRLNALAEGNDQALAATLKRELEAALGIQRPAGGAELKAMMRDPRYANPNHPQHNAYRQMIADGFRAAFPG